MCINLDHKVPCKLLESHAGLVFLQIDQSCSVYRNCPKSHHYTILTRPMKSSKHKPVIKKIESCDMQDSAWRGLG